MMREFAFVILLLLLVAVVYIMANEHRQTEVVLPKTDAAAGAEVIPWTMNNRCHINSQNLHAIEKERIA